MADCAICGESSEDVFVYLCERCWLWLCEYCYGDAAYTICWVCRTEEREAERRRIRLTENRA